MAHSLEKKHAEIFVTRINAVKSDAAPQWGKMKPAPMIAHLRRSLEISLCRTKCPDESNFISRTVIRYLVLNVLPIPKAKIKAPPMFFPEAEPIENEKTKFIKVMNDYFASSDAELAPHPFFGPLSFKQWSQLHGKHFDHHLRQFGA